MSASVLQQLMTLYFTIIYKCLLLSSEKSLVEKKSSIYLKDFKYLDFFSLFSFSLTNTCLPCQLREAYAVL